LNDLSELQKLGPYNYNYQSLVHTDYRTNWRNKKTT